jgi:hypothetical protein
MEGNLTALVGMFEEAEQANVTARDLAAKCRDYYDGNQLTPDEVAEMRRRKQPPIVINRIRRKVNWLRGLEMQSRTDPKAFPRTPKHEDGAQAATDAIRYVVDKEDFDKKRSLTWENMLIEGVGGVEVITDFRPPMREPEIKINSYAYDRLFHDPHSIMADFSDARYLGAIVWTDSDELKVQHQDKADEIDASINSSGGTDSDTYDDRPRWQIWSDPKRKRVRLVLVYYRSGGVWKWAKFVKGGILEEGESPYVDEDGVSVCPLIMRSAYVDRDGMRYGEVRDMLDPQDEVNKRRSKLMHYMNTRQTMGVKGAVSVSALKRELAKPDGHVEIDPDVFSAAAERGQKPFDLIQTSDQVAAQFSLLQESKAELDLMGANSGLAGKDPNAGSQSGRAIMARQQGGLIEIAPLTDGLSEFTREVYRHIWMRIRQFWRAEKWLRVTDDEKNARFVGLNRPITLGERLSQMPQEQVISIARQMQLVPNDPRLQMPVGVENAVEEIDVDILLEEVPDQVTLQGETFQQIVQIATSQPGAVPPAVLIELAPGLRSDVRDRLLEHIQQQSQAQNEAGAAKMQADMAEAEAKNDKTRADAAYSQARAVNENIEAQRKAVFGI